MWPLAGALHKDEDAVRRRRIGAGALPLLHQQNQVGGGCYHFRKEFLYFVTDDKLYISK